MPRRPLSAMSFASIYPLYVAKVQRKGRSADDVDQVISWLTGYDAAGLARAIDAEVDLATFFAQAPRPPARSSGRAAAAREPPSSDRGGGLTPTFVRTKK